MFSNTRDVWSVKDLQRNLGIGRNAAYALVNSGRIHSVKYGDKNLIPKVSVLDFLLGTKYNSNCNDGFNPQSGKENITDDWNPTQKKN